MRRGCSDLVIGGRISVTAKEVFAAIIAAPKTATCSATIGSSPPRAEPTFASTVVHWESGRTPRCAMDLVESNGRSLEHRQAPSVHGQRFRHPSYVLCPPQRAVAQRARWRSPRTQRVDFIDVDKDGKTKKSDPAGCLSGGLSLCRRRAFCSKIARSPRRIAKPATKRSGHAALRRSRKSLSTKRSAPRRRNVPARVAQCTI